MSTEFIYNFMKLSLAEKQKQFKKFTVEELVIFWKEKDKIYREVNRDTINEKSKINSKIYYQNNKDIITEKNKIYREKNRDKINEKRRMKYKIKSQEL